MSFQVKTYSLWKNKGSVEVWKKAHNFHICKIIRIIQAWIRFSGVILNRGILFDGWAICAERECPGTGTGDSDRTSK